LRGGRRPGRGTGRDLFGCALMRALAGGASLPCLLHLLEVTLLAWRLLSLRKRMCCNAPSELFFQFDLGLRLWGLCVVVSSFGSVF